MNKILIALMLIAMPLYFACAASEPASTDTLEERVEPKSMDKEYNPEVEEEIESDVSPLETEMQEDQPLFK